MFRRCFTPIGAYSSHDRLRELLTWKCGVAVYVLHHFYGNPNTFDAQ